METDIGEKRKDEKKYPSRLVLIRDENRENRRVRIFRGCLFKPGQGTPIPLRVE